MTAKRGKTKKEVVLWKDDVDWFNEHYRETPLSNILASLLHEFRVMHGDRTPTTNAVAAANSLKKIFEGI